MKIEVENETYLFIVSYPTFFRVYECVFGLGSTRVYAEYRGKA